MTSAQLIRYEAGLRRLKRRGYLRSLRTNAGPDFSSNDYLGLASSPTLRTVMITSLKNGVSSGSGGSRLLRGNHPEHERLEIEAATFFGSPSMLYFSSGYAANLAVFTTLPQRRDLVVHDALIHASVHDGIRSGKAEAQSAPHNDAGAFEHIIRSWREKGGKGTPWLVVESLYSMDGDCAPLSELIEIADRYEGFLLIDEAHATGVYGVGGRGLGAGLEGRDNVITLHTCGKAMGSAGALVGAAPVLRAFLVNRARPFIYSTAPSPLQAEVTRQALGLLRTGEHRRQVLHKLIAFANTRFRECTGYEGSGTQILPLIIGDVGRTLHIAGLMQGEGFDIRAIRPPTVPAGTARLRITITLNVDEETIARMFDCLAKALKEKMP